MRGSTGSPSVTVWPKMRQASCGVWREDSGLLSRPYSNRRPSSREDWGVSGSGGCAPVQPLPGGVLLAQCLCSPQNSRQSPNPQREGTVSPLHPNFQAANLLRCKCVPSAAGVSETAACPPSPTADDPSAPPSPTSSPSSSP